MKLLSMQQFRREADAVLKRVRKGQSFVLTYRGEPVARLVPIAAKAVTEENPIYQVGDLASESAAPASNEEIDRMVYGE